MIHKNIAAMLGIWKNFISGRDKFALGSICVVGVYFIIQSFILYGLPWGIYTALLWVVGVPCAVYIIDVQAKNKIKIG